VTAFFDLETFFSETRQRVDEALRERLPAIGKDDHLRLREAITAALLEGGKRLRPCLVVASCQAVGGDLARVLGPACAVEMIHAYSLVHDDLPAMDNDAVRRGKPTCHKQFGETAAILVGDALLTLAFEVVAATADAQGLKIVYELSRAAGASGMVGGQAMDMALKKSTPSFEQLELCHSGKTAALFSACGAVGALAGGGSEADVAQLRSCGFDLGLAFQHADDLEDADFTAHRESARRRAVDLSQRATRAAERFGDAGAALAALARWVEQRATRAKTPDGSASQS
jgi:geranylgeranyl pyrophosphate synthase